MTHYFIPEEFYCKCCGMGEGSMDRTLVKMLDEARWLYGKPINVTSGYRCLRHNTSVGGTKRSSHLTGLAVDIDCPSSRDRHRLVAILLAVGFKRIGIGPDFIHVDVDTSKTQELMWTY